MGANSAGGGRKGVGLDDELPGPFAGLVFIKPQLLALIEQRHHAPNIRPSKA
jgi:hypothetical protein